ncbi:MAG: NTP transferase domain-containing protein [Bacteroidetes bacterium]|nr:NTP transferase domain-containing protein [Bacteroidota bacterium]MBU1115846.1 NTP transferase domain-containing protein [Bacteroidota bacterium]MBU1797960.1 NTP transferase domain-containing protein [Bacteroidota bacterium]
MRAIIPVAGFGTRLKPHTLTHPKVLLNVGGKPIISHIVEKLIEENITEATFIVGYLGEKIEEYISSTFPMINAVYVEQKELLGLGHAIYQAAKTFNNEEIIIILGDTVFDVDLNQITKLETSSLGVKVVEDPRRFGVAELENGFITKLIEKPENPTTNLALVGLYYIKDSTLLARSLEELFEKNIKTNDEFQLTDALQIMINKGEKFSTFPVEGWYDCGKPETLLSTNQFILSQNGNNKPIDSVVIIEPVYISPTAIIKQSVIGPFVSIGDNCEIFDSVIKNSIINRNSKVKRMVLTDSIIGADAKVKGSQHKMNVGDSLELEHLND